MDRNGRAIRYAYDRADRAVGEKWYANLADALTNAATDGIGRTFDAWGRLVEQQYVERDGLGGSTLYRVTDSYQYDDLDRLVAHSNHSPTSTADTLYAPGDWASEIRQTYAYGDDGQGLRKTREQFVDGALAAQTNWHDNGFGELVALDDGETGSTGDSPILDFDGMTATFGYDASGALTSSNRHLAALFSDSRAYAYYSYDGAGRLASLDNRIGNYGGSSYESALKFTYSYDAASRIGGVLTEWYAAAWDPALAARVDELQTFQYDDAGQLTGVVSSLSANNADYNYGANGNRTSSEEAGGAEAYVTVPQNRVERDSTYRYEYDDEGNLTARWEQSPDGSGGTYDSGWRTFYQYDHRHRLIEVEEVHDDSVIFVVSYRYDAAGNLVFRQVDEPFEYGFGQPEHYVVENGRRTMTLDETDHVVRRAGYGPTGEFLFDQLFDGLGQETDALLPMGDHQNSTRLVLGPGDYYNLAIRQSIDYAPFGAVTAIYDEEGQLEETAPGTPDLDALDTLFAHHGSVLDAKTELQHKGARWYSPDLGRFVSEDPAQDGANWYAFAGNDPVNYADPTGLSQAGHPLSFNTTLGAGPYSGSFGKPSLIMSQPTPASRAAAFRSEPFGPVQPPRSSLPSDSTVLVRQIAQGTPIVPRQRADLPGVKAALDRPDQFIVANHSDQGYHVVRPDGGVKFVTGPEYLPIREQARRSQIVGDAAAGRAAALNFTGDVLIATNPYLETARDAEHSYGLIARVASVTMAFAVGFIEEFVGELGSPSSFDGPSISAPVCPITAIVDPNKWRRRQTALPAPGTAAAVPARPIVVRPTRTC